MLLFQQKKTYQWQHGVCLHVGSFSDNNFRSDWLLSSVSLMIALLFKLLSNTLCISKQNIVSTQAIPMLSADRCILHMVHLSHLLYVLFYCVTANKLQQNHVLLNEDNIQCQTIVYKRKPPLIQIMHIFNLWRSIPIKSIQFSFFFRTDIVSRHTSISVIWVCRVWWFQKRDTSSMNCDFLK